MSEVADRAAEKEHELTLAVRKVLEVVHEVADDAAHREPGVGRHQLLGAAADLALADVEGDIAREDAGPVEGVEEDAGLGGRPRAQLEHLAGAGSGHQAIGDAPQQMGLGAGEVVLGEAGDAGEELRAAAIVEIAGGDLARARGQRPAQLVEALLRLPALRLHLDGDSRVHHSTSAALGGRFRISHIRHRGP